MNNLASCARTDLSCLFSKVQKPQQTHYYYYYSKNNIDKDHYISILDYQLLRNGSTIQACIGGWLDIWGCYIDSLVSRAWNSHCPPLLKPQQELRLLLLSCVKVFINFRMHDLAAGKLTVSVYWFTQWDAKVSQQLNTRFYHENYQYCCS